MATINLCQPDDKKSCVACCGLMNHSDISRENLTHFLNDGHFRKENSWRYEIDGCYPEQTTSCREISSQICPFQGFISENRPGCLIHPLHAGEKYQESSLFIENTCSNYFCPAHTILNEKSKKVIIENIYDWYSYTIAIIDPISTLWILDEMNKLGIKSGEKNFKTILTEALEVHRKTLSEYKEIIFCYSMDEYNLERNNFSLLTDDENTEIKRKEIIQLINKKRLSR